MAIKMFDERLMMEQLITDTFALIALTTDIGPVKKLVDIHDVLSMNSSVLEKFKQSDLTFDEVWLDIPTIKHLNHLRCSLMVYHHKDFNCELQVLRSYNRSFCRFLNLLILRLKNGFDQIESIPKIIL